MAVSYGTHPKIFTNSGNRSQRSQLCRTSSSQSYPESSAADYKTTVTRRTKTKQNKKGYKQRRSIGNEIGVYRSEQRRMIFAHHQVDRLLTTLRLMTDCFGVRLFYITFILNSNLSYSSQFL